MHRGGAVELDDLEHPRHRLAVRAPPRAAPAFVLPSRRARLNSIAMPLESMNSRPLKSTTSARAEVGTACADRVARGRRAGEVELARHAGDHHVSALFDLELNQVHHWRSPFTAESSRVRCIRTVVPSWVGATSTVSINALASARAPGRGRPPAAPAMRRSRAPRCPHGDPRPAPLISNGVAGAGVLDRVGRGLAARGHDLGDLLLGPLDVAQPAAQQRRASTRAPRARSAAPRSKRSAIGIVAQRQQGHVVRRAALGHERRAARGRRAAAGRRPSRAPPRRAGPGRRRCARPGRSTRPSV